ncbi:MAG: hypothetical protein FGM39_01240 [Phycisphaerales bacterium]|nr:hypothetical protein [Phycisphaerales bacterium]
MTPDARHADDPRPVVVIRWLARAASLASIGLLVAFATSGGSWPTALEWALIACFPVGTVAGMALAWWKEIAGGLVTLASLVAFYAIYAVAGGGPPTGPWFIAFAAPGLALLGCGIAARLTRRSARASGRRPRPGR